MEKLCRSKIPPHHRPNQTFSFFQIFGSVVQHRSSLSAEMSERPRQDNTCPTFFLVAVPLAFLFFGVPTCFQVVQPQISSENMPTS